MEKFDFLVSVRCLTYNHSAYIEDAMNGFCMQKTDFPYVCVILDDASTDGEQEVIKNYLAANFEEISKDKIEEADDYVLCLARHKHNTNCYFATYFLKSNHYGKKPKAPYLEQWEINSKYVAYCEGDDYWIDSLKMQKQVDYMESHSDCSMTISNGLGLYTEDGNTRVLNPIITNESKVLTIKEVLREQGGLIPTASMCLRTSLILNEPNAFRKAPVGDRPLRMWCAINGSIFYEIDPMVTYRIASVGSFTERVRNPYFAKQILEGMNAVYDFFNIYTSHKYNEDVQFMKDRELYYYYNRINDFSSLIKCNFYKSLPLKRKLKIVFKHLLVSISPNLYRFIHSI